MGDARSGSCSREPTRQTTDNLHTLDVRMLSRANTLRPGSRSRWHWTRGLEPAGAIAIIATADAVVLDYKVHISPGGPWISVQERVEMERTPCPFGGSRPWFLCPGCGSRRAVMYLVGGRFRCRACHDLVYASTRENAVDCALQRANTLRHRLAPADDGRGSAVPPKPARMSRATYARILDQMAKAEDDALAAWTTSLDELLVRLEGRRRPR